MKEQIEAANNCRQFTQLFPVMFPEGKITRKMHVFSFIFPDLIMKSSSKNDFYTFLKVEQGGEKMHAVWNMLRRSKYFSIRDKKVQFLFTFLNHENLLYIDKGMFK